MANMSADVPERKYYGWFVYQSIPEEATIDEIREFLHYEGVNFKEAIIRNTSILVPVKGPNDIFKLRVLRSNRKFKDIDLDYSFLKDEWDIGEYLLQCARRKLNFNWKKC